MRPDQGNNSEKGGQSASAMTLAVRGTGLAIAMIAGWVIGRLKMERHLEE